MGYGSAPNGNHFTGKKRKAGCQKKKKKSGIAIPQKKHKNKYAKYSNNQG